MPDWTRIGRHIAESTREDFRVERTTALGGGSINRSFRVEGTGARRYFAKVNRASFAAMFEAESEGLAEIARTGTVRVPAPICHGVAGGDAYVVLEHVELGGAPDPAAFGERLARLHRHTAAAFGWRIDNTIGATPQLNTPCADWIAFYRERRLGFQLELARQKGCDGDLQRKGRRLMDGLERFFDGYVPQPSLLHGDLWSGNWDYDAGGAPVVFDPAVYYGDREADLAMTELFGSPGEEFYRAYDEAWPVDPGYRTRKTLYNLYHILNHLNLFGGYESQAEAMTDRLLLVI